MNDHEEDTMWKRKENKKVQADLTEAADQQDEKSDAETESSKGSKDAKDCGQDLGTTTAVIAANSTVLF